MAWPSNLVRTKDWGTEVLTDADLEGQFDLIINWIMAAMDKDSGHKHDATANEGPKLVLTDSFTGVLPEANGGTNQSAYTKGDILYSDADNSLEKLNKTTTTSHYLSNQGTDNIPQWEKVDIGSGIEIASQAQGDVLYFDGTNWARLGFGTDGQFLKTQGTGANPVWAASEGRLLSATAISAATGAAADITISANKVYKVVFEGVHEVDVSNFVLRFNSATTNYHYNLQDRTMASTPTVVDTGDNAANGILVARNVGIDDQVFSSFMLDTRKKNTHTAHIFGSGMVNSAGTFRAYHYGGVWVANTTITDFEIVCLTNTWTGNIYLYEMNLTA